MKQQVRLVQITDTHLYADSSRTLKGINTEASFQAVLALAREFIDSADLVLLTGDLAHDEVAPTYDRLKQTMDAVGTPYRAIPGNHDNPDLLFAALGQADSVDLGDWRIILLNSHVDGAVGGALASSEWQRLDAELDAAKDKNVLVCVHHHPLAVGSSWMDEIGLAEGDALLKRLARDGQVRLVLNGHIHQEFRGEQAGVTVLGSPSTNVQFQAEDDDPGFATKEPGFRSLTLHQDGSFDTGVYRVEGFAAQLDEDEAY